MLGRVWRKGTDVLRWECHNWQTTVDVSVEGLRWEEEGGRREKFAM